MTASNPVYVLDWDEPSHLMHLGARRASAFMALGLKSAGDETIRSVRLDGGLHRFTFMSDPMSEEESKDVRHNFSHWIIGNGLRELESFFNRAIDLVYQYYVVVTKGEMTIGELQKETEKFFRGTNSAAKLIALMDLLSMKANIADHVRSLSKARNVLTHNFGIVDDEAGLTVRWRGMDVVVDGVVVSDDKPFYVEKGGVMNVGFVDREKKFDRGQAIELTPRELHEICLTYIGQMAEVTNAIVEYARTKGYVIKVNTPAGDGKLESDIPKS